MSFGYLWLAQRLWQNEDKLCVLFQEALKYLFPSISTHFDRGENHMENEHPSEEEKIPKGQILFDNIWLWFILSVLLTGILYTVWGLIEMMNVPPAP